MTINLTLGMGLGGGGGSSFSPASLLGLVFWAYAGSLSASPVSSWSYGPANLTQGTGASQPTWSASSANVGNKPSVIYNGSQFLSAANASPLQITGDITISTVMYITASSGQQTMISKGPTGEYDCYINAATSGGGAITFVRAGNPVASSAGIVSDNTKTIVTLTQAGTTVTFYVNGTSQGTGTQSAGVSGTSNAVQLGQRSDVGTVLTGEQPEVIMYSRALGAGDLFNLHRYLGRKYGIAVP